MVDGRERGEADRGGDKQKREEGERVSVMEGRCAASPKKTQLPPIPTFDPSLLSSHSFMPAPLAVGLYVIFGTCTGEIPSRAAELIAVIKAGLKGVRP